jgi:hypothetical protein
MKIRQILVAGLLLAAAFNVHAQDGNIPLNEPNYNKPLLFNLLPARIDLSAAKLEQLIGTPNGQPTQIPVASEQNPEITGEVIGAVAKYNNAIQSVVIRCIGFDGARLTLSKVNLPDGTAKYTGRILSIRYGDLFQLEQENGNWALVKKNFYALINE